MSPTEPTNADDRIADQITAARRRRNNKRATRAALDNARQHGLAQRHTARLRNHNRGDNPMTTTPDLEQYEFDTTPLTAAERKAITDYQAATAGYADTFDQLDADTFHDIERTHADPQVAKKHAADLFRTLTDWHGHLDHVHAELSAVTASQSALSTAADRFTTEQATQFMDCLHRTRAAYCDWHLGTKAGPAVAIDAGHLLLSNFPPVALTTSDPAAGRVRRELDRIAALPTVNRDGDRANSFSTGARWAIRYVRYALDGTHPQPPTAA
jgi:hypothetical protein